MLRDLGSSNGTFVNGKRVLGQQTLKAGDVLTIGGVTLRVDPSSRRRNPMPSRLRSPSPATPPSSTPSPSPMTTWSWKNSR